MRRTCVVLDCALGRMGIATEVRRARISIDHLPETPGIPTEAGGMR